LDYLQKIVEGSDLAFSEAEALMGYIFSSATDAQIAALLIALRMKGESISEIAGFARKMKDSAVCISPQVDGVLVDIVGTGGDAANTINVSTAAAIVAAASGVPVAKHGNYAVSSKCGSANVLSELGVNITPAPEAVTAMIERLGIGFMLAPIFHPAMKRVAPVRRELGLRTVFNILGPLTNPAGARAQVVGVYDPRLCLKLASVFKMLGMDEIANTGETMIAELKDGEIESYSINPGDLGYPSAELADIAGGTPEDNARRLVSVLRGERSPARDIVAINAGAAVYISGQAESLKEGAIVAEEAISSGKALDLLHKMVQMNGDYGKLVRFL
jgi:anthranilate phosphoribosyltransferase